MKSPAVEFTRDEEYDERVSPRSESSPGAGQGTPHNILRKEGTPTDDENGTGQVKCLLNLGKTEPSSLSVVPEPSVDERVYPSFMLSSGCDVSVISPETFLAALEEAGVPNPEALHRVFYDMVKVLKDKSVLDKYVLSDDEAAVICAVSMLLINGIPFQGVDEPSKETPPNKLMIMILTALRKLPRYKGVVYFDGEKQERVTRRCSGDKFLVPFCASFKCMSAKKGATETGADEGSYKEIFRVEEGWGYDMSDFVLMKNESGCYGK